MVNGFRYYRALESVSIASALSTVLTIYSCQIRVHQRWQSKLPTSYYSEEGVAAGHSGQFTPMRLPVNTMIHTRLVGLEPAAFRSLVRRATSSATEPALTTLCVIQENQTIEPCPRSSASFGDRSVAVCNIPSLGIVSAKYYHSWPPSTFRCRSSTRYANGSTYPASQTSW